MKFVLFVSRKVQNQSQKAKVRKRRKERKERKTLWRTGISWDFVQFVLILPAVWALTYQNEKYRQNRHLTDNLDRAFSL